MRPGGRGGSPNSIASPWMSADTILPPLAPRLENLCFSLVRPGHDRGKVNWKEPAMPHGGDGPPEYRISYISLTISVHSGNSAIFTMLHIHENTTP